jgi:hypothetical protein
MTQQHDQQAQLEPLSSLAQSLPEGYRKFFVQYIRAAIDSTFASKQANDPENRFRDYHRQQVWQAERYFELCRVYFEQQPEHAEFFGLWGQRFGHYVWKVHDLTTGANVWDFVDLEESI